MKKTPHRHSQISHIIKLTTKTSHHKKTIDLAGFRMQVLTMRLAGIGEGKMQ